MDLDQVRMLPLPDTSRPVKSWASGYGSKTSLPYVSFSCANLDEIEQALREFMASRFPLVVLRRDEPASTQTYRKVDLLAHDDAPGLPGGPTQRRMLHDAAFALRRFLDNRAADR